MDGIPMTVRKVAATSGAWAKETPSPRRPVCSSFKIYVGNLPRRVEDSSLKQLFSQYGEVINAKVVYHHGRSWVFGFVTMATREARHLVPQQTGQSLLSLVGFPAICHHIPGDIMTS